MTSASANLVCFRWLESQNRLPEEHGFQRVSTYPSKARFRSGNGIVCEARYEADTPAGIAGNKGKFTACVLDADTPALLRRGAAEALSGNWISHVSRSFYLYKGRQFPFV